MTTLRYILFLLICLLVSYGATKIFSAESIRTVTKDYTGFDGIYLHGTGIIRLRESDTFKFTATADESILRITDVTINGDVLEIKYLKKFKANKIPEYTIELPHLDYIAAKGRVKVINDGTMHGDHLEIALEGKSLCQLDLEYERVDLKVRGESRCELRGSSDHMHIRSFGQSSVDALDFKVGQAKIDILGQGKTSIHVEEFLDVELKGNAYVLYRGVPRINTKIAGSGRIEALPYESTGSKKSSSPTQR